MIVLIHVIIALGSMVFTAVGFVAPSKNKLHISYGLVVATLASGTYLVVSTGAHMLQACMTGFLYLGVVTFGLVAAHRKLARQNNS